MCEPILSDVAWFLNAVIIKASLVVSRLKLFIFDDNNKTMAVQNIGKRVHLQQSFGWSMSIFCQILTFSLDHLGQLMHSTLNLPPGRQNCSMCSWFCVWCCRHGIHGIFSAFTGNGLSMHETICETDASHICNKIGMGHFGHFFKWAQQWQKTKACFSWISKCPEGSLGICSQNELLSFSSWRSQIMEKIVGILF